MLEAYRELRIREDYAIRPAAVLAPMAGVTDNCFRRLLREQGGCGLLMTEFTSADGLARARANPAAGGAGPRNRQARARMGRYLYFTQDERPIAAQLFGTRPDTLAAAAEQVEELGFDQVDINLGCPAKKVIKCGGSGLLRDLPLLETILRRVRAAVRLPLTIKIRAGWDEHSIVTREVGRLAEDCGVEAIALHPRTRVQGYAGQADWRLIAELKQKVKIPVIGNGDINRPEDAERMLRETGCDAIMIGRAAASNPWIFRQLADYFTTGRYTEATEQDRYRLLRGFCRRLLAPPAWMEGEQSAAQDPEALGRMKQFTSRFTHGVRGGAALRKAVYQARTPDEVLERLDTFFRHDAGAVAAGAVAD